MKTSVLFRSAIVLVMLGSTLVFAADKPDKAAKKGAGGAAGMNSDDGSKATGYFGDDGYAKTEASKDLKARPVDRDAFMSLHPRAYDHQAQPYTINPYRKPSPTYYRVSPFDNANSYFKGSAGY